MQGDSEDKGLNGIIDLFGAVGSEIEREKLIEQRKKEIEASTIRNKEELEGYIVYGMTNGCRRRVNTLRNDGEQHTFLVRDCLHKETGEDRVIKYPNPSVLVERPYLARQLEHEQKILALFNHPNIASQYGIIRKGKIPYLVLEYLPFQLSVQSVPDMEGVLSFAFESTKTLLELQRKDVIHGDIKEQQFMACEKPCETKRYRIKLLDFTGSIHPEMPPLKTSYTPSYAAPEVKKGLGKNEEEKLKAFTHKADIYSLGLVYARLALAEHMDPEEISDIFKEPDKSATRTIEALYDYREDSIIPPMFSCIVREMVKEDPNERPDARQLMKKLIAYCSIPGIRPEVTITKEFMSNDILRIRLISSLTGTEMLYESLRYRIARCKTEPVGKVYIQEEITEKELEMARKSLAILLGDEGKKY